MRNGAPTEMPWSDNGGQFRAALEQLFQELLYYRCAFVPPGHPASNGYAEVLNRTLAATHGGERRCLAHATRAYNAETKDRIGAAPGTPTPHEQVGPRRSTGRHTHNGWR